MKGSVIVQIRTIHEDKQTLGTAFVFDDSHEEIFRCKTLELPWRDNESNISCIPVGDYILKKRRSDKFGLHFHVQNVEGREWILWHSGNYHTQIRGCVLVGNDLADINKDGYRDVLNSRDTLSKLLELMPDEFPLIVTEEQTEYSTQHNFKL